MLCPRELICLQDTTCLGAREHLGGAGHTNKNQRWMKVGSCFSKGRRRKQCLLRCSGRCCAWLWSLQVWLLVSHSPVRASCLLV